MGIIVRKVGVVSRHSHIFFTIQAAPAAYFFGLFSLTYFDLCVVNFRIYFTRFPPFGEVHCILQRRQYLLNLS